MHPIYFLIYTCVKHTALLSLICTRITALLRAAWVPLLASILALVVGARWRRRSARRRSRRGRGCCCCWPAPRPSRAATRACCSYARRRRGRSRTRSACGRRAAREARARCPAPAPPATRSTPARAP